MLSWSAKFPDEVLHYAHDWTPALATGDSIASATAVAVGSVGLAAAVTGTVANVTTITLSGGTAPAIAIIQFSAVTASGELLGEDVSCAITPRSVGKSG